tara:strand:+ start:7699 stop:8304 length:606 start_codon:yes stop_codon:yes gene_type:complete
MNDNNDWNDSLKGISMGEWDGPKPNLKSNKPAIDGVWIGSTWSTSPKDIKDEEDRIKMKENNDLKSSLISKDELKCTHCFAGFTYNLDSICNSCRKEDSIRNGTEEGCTDAPISYSQIGNDIGELVAEKQISYGDSFGRSGAMLKILYPEGVPVEKLEDVLVIARVLDKIFRIATDNDQQGEDPWSDVAGYALLAIKRNLK